jgi:thiol-disulfide isomerase/thioredoxin
VTTAAALAAVLLVACGGGPEVDAVAAAGPSAPPRDAELVDGGWPETAAWIAREAERDRPTVVNLFASWCGPCREEAPVLRAAMAEHDEVAWLGIDHLDRRQEGAAFLAEERLDFDATIFDVTGDVAAGIGARGMPTTAVFDRDGGLVALHTGPVTEDDLERFLRDVGVGS